MFSFSSGDVFIILVGVVNTPNCVAGCTRNAAVMCLTRDGCGSGKKSQVDVTLLGFICSAVMIFGLYGTIPLALKAALTVSGVNACKNAAPNTPAKAPFLTPH